MSMSTEIASDFTQSTDTSGTGTESLGAWLARIRCNRGMESRDAARRLRLNPAIVQAIEADNFAWLGPPVFVRGYLSRYAQLLDLPETEVLERYRQLAGPSPEPPPLKVVLPLQRQTRLRDLRGLFYLILVIGIGWTAVQHLGDLDPGQLLTWWKKGNDSTVVSPAASPTTASTTQTHYPFQAQPSDVTSTSSASAPAESAAPPAGESPAPKPESTAPLATITTLPISGPVLPVPPVEHLPGAPLPELGATITAPVTGLAGATLDGGNAEAKLLLEFSNDCWVEIKDAQGNILTSGLMKANSTHSIAGAAPFKVTLGNAPAARIVLDDRLVDAAVYVPRRGTVSRFTLDRGQP